MKPGFKFGPARTKYADEEQEQMSDVIEFNYVSVDMAFFREDARRQEIPEPLLRKIAMPLA
jgi:hypothetical protein